MSAELGEIRWDVGSLGLVEKRPVEEFNGGEEIKELVNGKELRDSSGWEMRKL